MFTFPNPFRFVRAMWRAFIGWLHGGSVMVDDETLKVRGAICNTCLRFNRDFLQCEECGCFIPLKLNLKTEACPLGKWARVRLTPRRIFSTFCYHARRWCSKIRQ